MGETTDPAKPDNPGKSQAVYLERLMFAALAADIGMWHWDLITQELDWNARCKELFGFPEDYPMDYQSFIDVLHPDDRQRIHDAVQTSLRERTEYQVEMRIILPGGKLRWLMSKGHGFYDENGKPTSMHGIVLEITEQKEAEIALKESEEKFSKAFHAAPALFSISTLAGTYLDVNQTFLSTLQYQRDEIIGHTVHELGIWDDPGDRDRLIEIMRDNGKIRNAEIRLRNKSGALIIGLISTELITVGGQTCLFTLMRDITELKRAEREREQTLLQLELVLNSINEGVIVSDLSGNVLTMNRAALAFHDFEDVQQARRKLPAYEKEFEMLDLEGRPLPLELWPMARVMHKETFINQKLHIRRKGGWRLRSSSYSGTLAMDQSGSPALSVLTMRDIAPELEAEQEIISLNRQLSDKAEELEAANRELEAFNYSVAHDLRKPLTAINGYCQGVLEFCGAKLDAECHHFLIEAYRSTLQMNQLIDALLSFSRMAHVAMRFKQVDLTDLATTIATELQSEQPSRQATFRISNGITAWGDPELLRVALENLLGNAWKYTGRKEQPLIEFTGVENADELTCCVRDNGTGFGMADAQRIFEPFQRIAGSAEFKGHGIGLATASRIIRRHGGRIWAEGEPGRGASFYFTIPSRHSGQEPA